MFAAKAPRSTLLASSRPAAQPSPAALLLHITARVPRQASGHSSQAGRQSSQAGFESSRWSRSSWRAHRRSSQDHRRSSQDHRRSSQDHSRSSQNQRRCSQNHRLSSQDHRCASQDHRRSSQRPATSEPPQNHLRTISEPPQNHLGTTSEPPQNHLRTTSRSLVISSQCPAGFLAVFSRRLTVISLSPYTGSLSLRVTSQFARHLPQLHQQSPDICKHSQPCHTMVTTDSQI